jgi:hypothetical protein
MTETRNTTTTMDTWEAWVAVVFLGDNGCVDARRLDGDHAAASSVADVSYSSINPTSTKNGRRSIDVCIGSAMMRVSFGTC